LASDEHSVSPQGPGLAWGRRQRKAVKRTTGPEFASASESPKKIVEFQKQVVIVYNTGSLFAGTNPMMLARRTLLGWMIAALNGDLLRELLAQDRPSQTAPPQPRPDFKSGVPYRSPYQLIENAASQMKSGDSDSIRAVVEALYKYPWIYQNQMPEVMAAVVKQRLIDAQMAYLAGKTAGVVDGAVVDAINALATAFDTPDYARTSLLQVRFFRSSMTVDMPIFMRSAPSAQTHEANPPMSPLQGMWIMSLLIDQKISNPDYQATPAEWDRDVYPKLLEQERARQELQRRIAAGEVQVKAELRASVSISHSKGDLLFLLPQRIREMSVADGLKLFNETFARLGIR
jgi:hypothetical protein